MIAVDASVVIPGLVTRHPLHEAALPVLDRRPLLPLHAALEVYAVLTRSPEGIRVPPAAAAAQLRETFEDRIIQLGKRDVLPFLDRVAAAGVLGSAVYDAFIAETARRNHAALVTRDRRAAATYDAIGAEVAYLEGFLSGG